MSGVKIIIQIMKGLLTDYQGSYKSLCERCNDDTLLQDPNDAIDKYFK